MAASGKDVKYLTGDAKQVQIDGLADPYKPDHMVNAAMNLPIEEVANLKGPADNRDIDF